MKTKTETNLWKKITKCLGSMIENYGVNFLSLDGIYARDEILVAINPLKG